MKLGNFVSLSILLIIITFVSLSELSCAAANDAEIAGSWFSPDYSSQRLPITLRLQNTVNEWELKDTLYRNDPAIPFWQFRFRVPNGTYRLTLIGENEVTEEAKATQKEIKRLANPKPDSFALDLYETLSEQRNYKEDSTESSNRTFVLPKISLLMDKRAWIHVFYPSPFSRKTILSNNAQVASPSCSLISSLVVPFLPVVYEPINSKLVNSTAGDLLIVIPTKDAELYCSNLEKYYGISFTQITQRKLQNREATFNTWVRSFAVEYNSNDTSIDKINQSILNQAIDQKELELSTGALDTFNYINTIRNSSNLKIKVKVGDQNRILSTNQMLINLPINFTGSGLPYLYRWPELNQGDYPISIQSTNYIYNPLNEFQKIETELRRIDSVNAYDNLTARMSGVNENRIYSTLTMNGHFKFSFAFLDTNVRIASDSVTLFPFRVTQYFFQRPGTPPDSEGNHWIIPVSIRLDAVRLPKLPGWEEQFNMQMCFFADAFWIVNSEVQPLSNISTFKREFENRYKLLDPN